MMVSMVEGANDFVDLISFSSTSIHEGDSCTTKVLFGLLDFRLTYFRNTLFKYNIITTVTSM